MDNQLATTIKDGKTFVNISLLKEWDQNPRNVKEADFTRLLTQIQKFGQYKPLLITPDGTVLGGNMRLRAYRQLGLLDIWISIIKPKTEAEMVEYALSDNDRAGYYEQDKVIELVRRYEDDLDLTLYKLDLGEAIDLQLLKDNYDNLDKVNDQDEWVGMPEFETKDTPFKLIVSFDSEEDREDFVSQSNIQIQKKLKNVWVTWYPFKEIEDKSSVKYE